MPDNPLSDSEVLSLLALTKSMSQAVENNNWDEVEKLDAQRLAILHTDSSTDHQSNTLSLEERKILESDVRERDANLQKSMNDKYREAVSDRRTFNARQTAMKNYISTSSLNR